VKDLAAGLGEKLEGFVALARNGSARRSGEAEVVSAFEQSPHCTLLADGASLRIVGSNEAMRRALGFDAKNLHQLSLADVFHRAGEGDSFLQLLRSPDPKIPLRAQQRSSSGKLADVEIVGYRVDAPRRPLLAFMTQDITLRTRFEARLLERQGHLDHIAHHDSLTGLPNRLSLSDQLPNAIESARRMGKMLAVLCLDLDRFKHINDSRGHVVGDLLLTAVARRLRQSTREEDMVVRVGGDEFIVVLREAPDQQYIDAVAVRLLEAIARPFDIGGQSLAITVSIGISQFPRDGADMGALLRHSDTAMYDAKQCGRNNCQSFNPTMERRLKQRANVEAQLREALLTGQLDVHYQPIVDLKSQRVVALESLLRWKHPTRGFIAPAHFIGIAEETGLIVPIGEFVLQRVLHDASHWRASGGTLVPISMNVSATQLRRSNFPKLLSKSTGAHGFEPSLLQIELTESALFDRREGRSSTRGQDAISSLRELGVHIAIDDFGTGFSSLAHLKRWRVDSLKIDRSFVRDLLNDPSDLAIVGAITAMARHLDVPVTAEGIEGWQQLAKLRELGCQLAQGHLFSRAVPASQILPYLKGGLIALAGFDPNADTLEGTGLNGALLEELLLSQTGS
jgi:diguanylate cyclase (GGDEF)-like protein